MVLNVLQYLQHKRVTTKEITTTKRLARHINRKYALIPVLHKG